MATLAYTTAIQDSIARRLTGGAYSTLTADQKAMQDGTWTTGSLTTGYAYSALSTVQQYSQYFTLAAPASAPQEWENWLIAKTVLMMASSLRMDTRTAVFEKEHDEAMMAAVDAYQRNLITYDPGSTPEAATLTVQNLRYYVVATCARRQRWETVEGTARMKPRLWVPFELVDAQIERVLRDLWNRADWPFKRRAVTMTITPGTAPAVTVSFDLSGETFQSVAVREFWYPDSGLGRGRLLWAKDGTEMSRYRAAAASSGASTGRPNYFRFETNAATVTWTMYPFPDQAYTAKGEVYVKGPSVTTLTATTTAMARFPAEFDHVIKRRVLAEVLKDMGDREGERMWRATEDEIEELLPRFCDVGRQDDTQDIRDVYRDFEEKTGWDNVLGGGM